MADFVSGKNTTFRLYWNGSVWTVAVKSWSIEEVAVEAEDGVNGEQRDRLQKIVKYYKATFETWEDGASQTLQNLITSQANDDAFLPQLPLGGGILFRNQDGSKMAFTLKGCTMGPLKTGSSGRTERIAHSLSFRAQYFNQVAAA